MEQKAAVITDTRPIVVTFINNTFVTLTYSRSRSVRKSGTEALMYGSPVAPGGRASIFAQAVGFGDLEGAEGTIVLESANGDYKFDYDHPVTKGTTSVEWTVPRGHVETLTNALNKHDAYALYQINNS